VFEEALRVLKNGGKLGAGGFIINWLLVERRKTGRLMSRVLKEKHDGRIRLKPLRKIRYGLEIAADVYEVEKESNLASHPIYAGPGIDYPGSELELSDNADIDNYLAWVLIFSGLIMAIPFNSYGPRHRSIELPRDEEELVDVKAIILPSREKLEFFTDPQRLKEDIRLYIEEYLDLEKAIGQDLMQRKKELALRNLDNPYLMLFMQALRRYNILLVVSRNLDMAKRKDQRKFEQYFPTLLRVFQRIPPELLWEVESPIGWEVTKTDAKGFLKVQDEHAGGGINVTVFEEFPYRQFSFGRFLSSEGTLIYDEEELLKTIVHELIGHKRSLGKRARYRVKDGKIRKIRGKIDYIMTRAEWLEVARRSQIEYVLPMTQEIRDSILFGTTIRNAQSVHMNESPRKSQDFLEFMLNLATGIFNYYQDPREIVAYSTEDDDLKLPASGQSYPRNENHNHLETRKILLTSVGRIGIPVDPEQNVYVTYVFNSVTGQFSRHYVQNKGTKTYPRWFRVKLGGSKRWKQLEPGPIWEVSRQRRTRSPQAKKRKSSNIPPLPINRTIILDGSGKSYQKEITFRFTHPVNVDIGRNPFILKASYPSHQMVLNLDDLKSRKRYVLIRGDQPINEPQKFTAGRSYRNDIVLKHRSVSREHLEIIINYEVETVTIKDLGSKNLTTLSIRKSHKRGGVRREDQKQMSVPSEWLSLLKDAPPELAYGLGLIAFALTIIILLTVLSIQNKNFVFRKVIPAALLASILLTSLPAVSFAQQPDQKANSTKQFSQNKKTQSLKSLIKKVNATDDDYERSGIIQKFPEVVKSEEEVERAISVLSKIAKTKRKRGGNELTRMKAVEAINDIMENTGHNEEGLETLFWSFENDLHWLTPVKALRGIMRVVEEEYQEMGRLGPVANRLIPKLRQLMETSGKHILRGFRNVMFDTDIKEFLPEQVRVNVHNLEHSNSVGIIGYSDSEELEELREMGKNKELIKFLRERLKKSNDSRVQEYIIEYLGALRAREAAEDIRPFLYVDDLQIEAAVALGRMADSSVIDVLNNPKKYWGRYDYTSKVLEALGYSEDPSMSEYVIPFLDDTNDSIRGAAIEASARLGNNDEILERIHYLSDPNTHIQNEMLRALGIIADARAISELLEYIQDPENEWRGSAISVLVDINNPSVKQAMLELLKDKERNVRFKAYEAAQHFGASDDEIFQAYRNAGKDGHKDAQKDAAVYFGRKLPDEAAFQDLLSMLDYAKGYAMDEVVKWLGESGDSRVIEPLKQKFINKDGKNYTSKIDGILREQFGFNDKNMLKIYMEQVKSPNIRAIGHAVNILRRHGDKKAIPGIIQSMAFADRYIFDNQVLALTELGATDKQMHEAYLLAFHEGSKYIRDDAMELLRDVNNDIPIIDLAEKWRNLSLSHKLSLLDYLSGISGRQSLNLLRHTIHYAERKEGVNLSSGTEDQPKIDALMEQYYSQFGWRTKDVRMVTVDKIVSMRAEISIPYLLEFVADFDHNIRHKAYLSAERKGASFEQLLESLRWALFEREYSHFGNRREKLAQMIREMNDPRTTDLLNTLLGDVNSDVIVQAVFGLQELGVSDDEIRDRLLEYYHRSTDDGQLEDEDDYKPWIIQNNAYERPDYGYARWSTRTAIADAMGHVALTWAIEVLDVIRDTGDYSVVDELIHSYGHYGSQTVPQLIEMLENPAFHSHYKILRIFKELKDPRPFDAIVPLLFSDGGRKGAVWTLVAIDPEKALPHLIERLNMGYIKIVKRRNYRHVPDPYDDFKIEYLPGTHEEVDDAGVIGAVAEALGQIRDIEAVVPLINALQLRRTYHVETIIEALGDLGDWRAIEHLIPLLEDSDKNVRRSAQEALEKIIRRPIVNIEEFVKKYNQGKIKISQFQVSNCRNVKRILSSAPNLTNASSTVGSKE